MTVEVEKVEGEEDGLRRGTFAASAAERALQRSEVRPALGIENDGLTARMAVATPRVLAAAAIAGNGCVQSWPPRVIADALRLDVNGEQKAIPFDHKGPIGTGRRSRLSRARHGSTRLGVGSKGRLDCAGSRLRRAWDFEVKLSSRRSGFAGLFICRSGFRQPATSSGHP